MTNKEAINILLNTIQLPATRGNGKSLMRLLILETIQKAVEALETTDVAEKKKGEWIEVQRYEPTDKMAINECSLCHNTIWMYDGDRRWKYCPNCGARMNEREIKEEKMNNIINITINIDDDHVGVRMDGEVPDSKEDLIAAIISIAAKLDLEPSDLFFAGVTMKSLPAWKDSSTGIPADALK